MNAGMKMMLVSNAQRRGNERDGDRREGNNARYDNGERGNYGRGDEYRYDGRENGRERTRGGYDHGEYEPEGNGTEMRRTRRRRYEDGRFRPTRGGADYLHDPDDDDDEPEARYPRMLEPEGRMNQIGFVAGGHSKVTEMHRGGSRMYESEKLDKATAEEWVRSMENEDGTKGPHWTMEQVKQVMAQKGVTGEPVEFFVALNMVYSDYCKVAKKLGVNSIDFYVEMARAFLEDKDAGEGKLMNYYEYVVK